LPEVSELRQVRQMAGMDGMAVCPVGGAGATDLPTPVIRARKCVPRYSNRSPVWVEKCGDRRKYLFHICLH